jgi:hypothetical protein
MKTLYIVALILSSSLGFAQDIFTIIATPEKSLLGRNRLIGLGNGTVVAIDGQGLHFIKLK